MRITDRAFGNGAVVPAVLLTLLGWAGTTTLPAAAQLGTPPGNVIVTITEPSAGSSVGGIIAVSAEVTGAGRSTVVGVQFELDGQPLGAEAGGPPYSIPWDTLTVSDGVHALSAVARDVLGVRYSSEPIMVTVWNGTTPPATTLSRSEETSAAYTPDGTWWLGNTDRAWSGGTAAVGFLAGQRATFTFSGAGVSWIGFRGPQAGIADVYLNGIKAATVDAYASDETVGAVLYAVTGLEFGTHTLTIEATRTRHPLSSDYFVVVDAFDVLSGGR
jgi:hypothetical protein